jgi:hypothetical protein
MPLPSNTNEEGNPLRFKQSRSFEQISDTLLLGKSPQEEEHEGIERDMVRCSKF